MCGVDYEGLKNILEKVNVLPIYKEIEKIENEIVHHDEFVSADVYYAEKADVKNLATQLIYYLSAIYKNYVFKRVL
jgi:hypothetical protein